MRTRTGLYLGLIIVMAGALVWAGARAALPAAPRPVQRPGAPNSEVFTPAHRTVLGAVKDFFGWHRIPVQPIAYTHKVHLANGMHCTDCHVGVDTGPDARIPNVQLCMTCHSVIDTDNPEIKKIAAYYGRGELIPWQRVYDYPAEAHVKFNHAPHIRAGVDCKACHGDMTQQTVAVRSVNLTMGYCIDCHKQKQASIDCTTCHF